MTLYVNGTKVVNSLVIDGDTGVSHSLVNKCAVATSSTTRYKDRVDANNYISVSGNTVTLTRNNASNWLSFYTDLLEAGKSYAFIFDSITNTDSNIYIGTVSDISANPYSATRIRTESLGQNTIGWVVTPTVSGVYDFLLGQSNTNPIVCVNPRLIAIDEVAESGKTDSEETIWTSGDVSDPAIVSTSYTFSATLDKFEAIKLVITSPSDGANGIYSEEIWSVESINNVIADSHTITPVPVCAGFYGVKERYFNIDISNTGFTVTGNGAVNESVSARPSVFAIIGIKYSNVEKIFDTGSITSLVAVNSQQTLLKSLDNFDLVQVVFSNANDGANGVLGTYTFDAKVALTTGMICKAYWYKYRQMTLSFTNNTFTTLSSSANAEASGYNILVYQMYGIKL